jgi:hypothetical protein
MAAVSPGSDSQTSAPEFLNGQPIDFSDWDAVGVPETAAAISAGGHSSH